MLEGIDVTKKFGGLAALSNVSFNLAERKITSLIGPNGAGKTTLFNLIVGFYRPTSGEIKFKGKEIAGLSPHQICRLGIARTHQLVRPFLDMSVLENVLTGAFFGVGKRRSLSDARKHALHFVQFVNIEDKRNVLARNLTFADRRRVEVARALATEPEVLLLDEIVSGLNLGETLEAIDLLKKIRDDLGITIFWVEHVMRTVMELADHVIVLHYGEKIAEGATEEISSNEKVIDAYLGKKYIL